MSLLQRPIINLFDLTLTPLQSLSPLWSLGLVSMAVGLLMLLVFRYASDQSRLRETKNAIKANVLEMWLFRDDPRVMLSSQGRLFRLNGRYLKLAAKPLLVVIFPIALILIHLESWYGYRPLHVGEAAIVSVQLAPGQTGFLKLASLRAKDGLSVETPPLRITPARQVNWRIRAEAFGTHVLQVEVSGQKVEKTLIVSDKLVPVSPRRVLDGFWNQLLNPREMPIPEPSPVEQVEVRYPTRTIALFGWKMHWITAFFMISILSGFALKGWFRVEL
jgi:hypothetical protein